MSELIYIAIFGKTYPVKEYLKKAGLKWVNHAWVGVFPSEFSSSKIEVLKKFCCERDLQYVIKQNGIVERRLPRGPYPVSSSKVAIFMGEGRLQWAIEETLSIEKARNKNQARQSKRRRR